MTITITNIIINEIYAAKLDFSQKTTKAQVAEQWLKNNDLFNIKNDYFNNYIPTDHPQYPILSDQLHTEHKLLQKTLQDLSKAKLRGKTAKLIKSKALEMFSGHKKYFSDDISGNLTFKSCKPNNASNVDDKQEIHESAKLNR